MAQFKKRLEKPENFAKGPYIDYIGSFKKGQSLKEFIKSGVLSKDFRILYPNGFEFFKHQEEAIKKIIIDDKNLVVSTGTGSGKTEAFLIPIINHLMREKEKGTLSDGVRALIIYPMNALANDQMKRMRGLLKDYPDITFGSYTGETKKFEKEAFEKYELLNKSKPIINQLISREKMIEHPPHIFITNYAMLEFLMLRPEENVFFNGEKANKWKYIVLDEAHTYTGATGIEVSMLLRRLKNQLIDNEKIRFILTSATLGGEKDKKKVCKFATKLCADVVFNEESVIHAKREKININEGRTFLNPGIYCDIYNYLENADIEKDDSTKLKYIIQNYFPEFETKSEKPKTILFDLLIKDKNYHKIRSMLLESSKPLEKLSEKIEFTQEELVAFVFVANKAEKNNIKLFDARYHMFLKSLEGVFVTLGTKKTLTVFPHNTKIIEDEEYKCYKIAVCKYCGQIFIEGSIEEKAGKGYLVQKAKVLQNKKTKIYMVCDNEQAKMFSDNYAHEDSLEYLEKTFILCGKCGMIYKKASINPNICNCSNSNKIELIEVEKEKKRLYKCLNCSNQNNISGVLRTFYLGQEAAASVIGTSLYEEIPSERLYIKREIIEENNYFDSIIKAETKDHKQLEQLKKQLLIFSDSRQAAAYFASYFDTTYNRLLRRRLLIYSINKLLQENPGEKEFSIKKVVSRLSATFEYFKMFDGDFLKTEAWKTILYEISCSDRNSLENLGLVSFEIKLDVPHQSNEKTILLKLLANSFKRNCIFDFELSNSMEKIDKEYYLYNGYSHYMCFQKDKKANSTTHGWIPRGKNNGRIDLLKRILNLNEEDSKKVLRDAWDFFKKGFLISKSGDKYQMDISKLIVKPSLNEELDWYICDKCGKLTIYNISNVCPTYRCTGKLRKCDIDKEFIDNHYRKLYTQMEIFPMICKEHTAQLSPELAREYQEKFVKKEINVLSCSTTFEMGVDVGELETIFMKNMPPTPANYVQRAGRAGRRSDAVAYSLTFCKLSSHDINFFQRPTNMIDGKIMPPSFKVENIKIIKRHMNAAIISYFWRNNPEIYGEVSDFFDQANFSKFLCFLKRIPDDLKNYLKAFVPQVFNYKIKEWVQEIFGEESFIKKIRNEYIEEITELKNYLEELKEKQNDPNEKYAGTLSDKIKRYIAKTERERVLVYLSRKNIIPKYGFPIDTVELVTSFDKNSLEKEFYKDAKLRLQRDLKIAISEYAPGSEVIANGQILKSQFVKKPKGKNNQWEEYQFAVCENENCNHLNIRISELKEKDWQCEVCNGNIKSNDFFIIPRYGFIISPGEPVKATTKKPEKTYHSEIFYVGDDKELSINGERVHRINGYVFRIKSTSDDELAIVNSSFFHVCPVCGYSEVEKQNNRRNFRIKKHNNPYGVVCKSEKIYRKTFGHIFKTDVVILSCDDYIKKEKALSILYALLEGISRYLGIERNDISGTIHSKKIQSGDWQTAFVIFDTVPGGAGHVRRIGTATKKEFSQMLQTSYSVVKNCTCGIESDGDSACYNCLCNYYNQAYHDILKRKYAIEFFEPIFK